MIADALQRKVEALTADWRSRAGDLRHEREPSARLQGWAVGLDEAADELDAALATLQGVQEPPLELLETAEIVVNSLDDVWRVGWAPSVNPQRWAEQCATPLRAACERARATVVARAPQEPPAGSSFVDWATHIVEGLETKAPSQIEWEIVEGLRNAYQLGRQEARPAPPLDWQPIATAPKDGRYLLLVETMEPSSSDLHIDPDAKPVTRVTVGRWASPGWDRYGVGSILERRLSLWATLPDPPAAVPQAAPRCKACGTELSAEVCDTCIRRGLATR